MGRMTVDAYRREGGREEEEVVVEEEYIYSTTGQRQHPHHHSSLVGLNQPLTSSPSPSSSSSSSSSYPSFLSSTATSTSSSSQTPIIYHDHPASSTTTAAAALLPCLPPPPPPPILEALSKSVPIPKDYKAPKKPRKTPVASVKWSKMEDEKLRQIVTVQGAKNWRKIAEILSCPGKPFLLRSLPPSLPPSSLYGSEKPRRLQPNERRPEGRKWMDEWMDWMGRVSGGGARPQVGLSVQGEADK